MKVPKMEIDEDFWDEDGDWDEFEEDDELESDCFGQYYLGVGSEECEFCPWRDACISVSKAQLKDQNKKEEEE